MKFSDISGTIFFTIALKYNYIFWIAIVCIAAFISLMDQTSEIDKGATQNHPLTYLSIYDSTINGYTIYLYSKVPVTEQRAESMMQSNSFNELCQRITSSVKKINMLDSDPYDVVRAINNIGLPDSIGVLRIEGYGYEKHKQYLQSNPFDSTFATSPSISIPQQGMVFIESADIMAFSSKKEPRAYRYVQANFGEPVYSLVDEKFSHIHPFEYQK